MKRIYSAVSMMMEMCMCACCMCMAFCVSLFDILSVCINKQCAA